MDLEKKCFELDFINLFSETGTLKETATEEKVQDKMIASVAKKAKKVLL